MTPASVARTLYTPEILGLAVSLASYPLDPDLPLTGTSRSKTCGSEVALALRLSPDGTIAQTGLHVRACAIGQAAAALFAQSAQGRTADEIDTALAGLELWLAGEGPCPHWPGLAILDAARDYPARHSAILLPWKAASAALGKAGVTG